MFSRGQGSFEYLLVIAGVMAIAIVAVLVAGHVFSSAQPSESISNDKTSCGVAGIELLGYTQPYDGSKSTAPQKIKPCGTCAPLSLSSTTASVPSSSSCQRFSSCKLQNKYTLSVCFSKGKWSAYLQSSGGWLGYGTSPSVSNIYPFYWTASQPVYSDKTCGYSRNPVKGKLFSSDDKINIYFHCSPGSTYDLIFYVSRINLGDTTGSVYVSVDGSKVEKDIDTGWNTLHGVACDPKNKQISVVISYDSSNIDICLGNNTNDYKYPPYLKPVTT